MIFLD
jgi:hypothetical protein